MDNKKPFAHIDIAGLVWDDKTGATGFGAKLVTDCGLPIRENYNPRIKYYQFWSLMPFLIFQKLIYDLAAVHAAADGTLSRTAAEYLVTSNDCWMVHIGNNIPFLCL